MLLNCNDITTTNSQSLYNPSGSKSPKENFIVQEANYDLKASRRMNQNISREGALSMNDES